MRKRKNAIMIGLCAGLMVSGLWGCTIDRTISTLVSEDETYEKEEDGAVYEKLTDKASWYEGEEEPEVVTMYLTVGKGNEEEGTDHTWAQVNEHSVSWYTLEGLEPYKCEAVLQAGDEEGPLEGEFGYGDLTANATVCLRGKGASEQPQKSYRIDIKQGKGKWEGQKTVLLNKHVTDPLRLKNRLCYSLMQEIPHMFSARTRFVHLYVKDKTEGRNGLFEDYGLYTAVEQINKTYLKNHGLDNSGQLYQAENFDWGLHAESLQLATSASYKEADFEEYLQIKGDPDHIKLLAMLNVVNSENMTGSQLVDTYFDKENLYYWMAFHMLMGNEDVSTGNYYLYSPLGSERWYVLSWNNADVLSESYREMREEGYSRSWNHGIFTYLNAPLYQKIFKDERCRREFDEAVKDLRDNYLTREKLRQKMEEYGAIVKLYLFELPDRMYARVTDEEYDRIMDRVAGEVESNYQAYLDSLKEPWPFHILAPERAGV